MRRMSIVLMMVILVFGFTVSSHAILIDRGGGMIYSTDLNVTWLQDANYARTSGFDDDGLMSWYQAMEWVATLEYGGYDDWRLPRFDSPTSSQCDVSTLHEMRYLLYTELGIPCGAYPDNFGPFINVLIELPGGGLGQWYWSLTETDPDHARRFSFTCG